MWKRIALLVVLAIVLPRLWTFWNVMGFHKALYNHQPGKCRTVEGIENGSEDLELLANGKVIISSGLRMDPSNPNYAGVKGRLYLFDLEKPASPPQLLKLESRFDSVSWNFHGLSSWTDSKTGTIYVYVINHRDDESVVEKFKVDLEHHMLVHLNVFGSGDANFRLLNDLAVVAEDQFYYTNYQYYRSQLEPYLVSYWGSIGYFDGLAGRIVTSGLLLPNGIQKSVDARYIYLAHISTRSVEIYDRKNDNSLAFRSSYPLYTAPDNIIVDPTNSDLWLGAHPVGWKSIRSANNPRQIKTPSQVLRLRMNDGNVSSVEEVLMDDGTMVSGSSVAVPYKNKLLVGTVADTMLYCEMI